MTILGRGDLVPRRRRRRPGRLLGVALLAAALAAGGYLGYRQLRGDGSGRAQSLRPAAPRTCPSPAAAVSPARGIRLEIRNGSLRTGLAAAVAHQLRRHSFRVASIGNALRVDRRVATIRYTPDQQLAAATLARYVPRAVLTGATGHHRLELDLGTRFRALAAPAAVRAADRLRHEARAAAHCSAASSGQGS